MSKPSPIANTVAHRTPLRQTRAIVDFDTLANNLTLLAKHADAAGVMPLLKADAYGHGIVPVARQFQQLGAAMLGVANAQELEVLRKAGIDTPILVLEELFDGELESAIRNNGHLSVGDLRYAERLSQVAVRVGLDVGVHLNVDLDIGRMGLLDESVEPVAEQLAKLPGIRVYGLYGHFPNADEADLAPTRSQLQRFEQIVARIAELLPDLRYRHVANSGAVLQLGRHAAFDLVRPGIALYGIAPSPEVQVPQGVRPALSLVSRIVRINRYRRKGTVGYGMTYTAHPGAAIAVIPIGYGDGYPRALSNCGSVLIGGREAPIVGRVSMDMITVDITDHPASPQVGDSVVLIGTQADAAGAERSIEAADIAVLCDTIPYEITCNLAARIPRVYRSGGQDVAWSVAGEGLTASEGIDR